MKFLIFSSIMVTLAQSTPQLLVAGDSWGTFIAYVLFSSFHAARSNVSKHLEKKTED